MPAHGNRASQRRGGVAWLIAAAALSPIATRAAILYDQGAGIAAADGAGFLSDLAIALAFAAVLGWIGSRVRWVALLAVAVWCLLHYANYEHVRVLGSAVQFTYAGYIADPVFFQGSALAPARPGLLASILAASLGFAWLASRGALPRLQTAALGLGAAAGLVLHGLVPDDPEAHAWRRRHLVHENVQRALRASGGLAAEQGSGLGPGPEAAVFAPDLSGEPIVRMPRPRTNVLLIVLEGVTGGFVDTIARRHGIESRIEMAGLDRIAERNFVATSFITHQRQTNRGLYSLLCGDYPKLSTALAKMTEYLQGGDRVCLSGVLGDAGYQTVYLQGAPLAFMFKDVFMDQIGFDRVLGDRWFDEPYFRGKWGVDDLTLFRRGLDLVRELQAARKPWFMTILTVGTHHPFTVPNTLRSRFGGGVSTAAAMNYLDAAVEEFVGGLEEEGVLDDTLVIITSDESRGLEHAPDDLTLTLSQSWSPLVALLPSREQMEVHEPTGQIDVAISILDYLGIGFERTEFIGRSIFRRYREPRPVFFANTFHGTAGLIDSDGHLVMCDEFVLSCRKYALESGGMFGPRRVPIEWDPDERDLWREVVRRSMKPAAPMEEVIEYPLVHDPVVPIDEAAEWRFVASGQNLYVRPRSRIDVEIEAQLEGESGTVGIAHKLKNRESVFFEMRPLTLTVGERVKIKYAYVTGQRQRIERLHCELMTRKMSGGDLRLRVRKGRIRIGPDPDPAAGGSRIRDREIAVEPS